MNPLMMPAIAEGATLTWSTVSGAFTDAFSLVSSCMQFIVDNSVFVTLFALGLVPLGFKILKKAKRAVK